MLKLKIVETYFIFFISIFCLFLSSCASKKNVLYIQDIDKQDGRELSYNTNKIQVNDILAIKVSSLYPETAIPYNFDNSLSTNSSFIETLKLQGSLVSSEGYIILPIIGSIKATGKSTTELELHIKSILESGNYLQNAIVSVRILNSKITILGEVITPGTYTITEQNITILQALGYAGDLKINADRKDILIIRDVDGKQLIKHIDLTKTDWFDSPFYFIKQNDVIVVNPNNTKIKSSGYIGNVGTVLTIASILLSTVVILTR
ncbi:polysaccharide biosynthesis/export family protein [Flavivirga jejuensis]|uniref:Polysaccharide biosynthesis/export family protein n=1 Tax=Flavivirga jejuensis TaxID=870487 RepID=A0ABT8WT75_9FLAO|nr:polysaccharide biosynthesis/export family protein [Flavivirga jejuensis]MDO5976388.1 polysaccharide biosynthesis/export family protein [Flavivirga jejuensis]